MLSHYIIHYEFCMHHVYICMNCVHFPHVCKHAHPDTYMNSSAMVVIVSPAHLLPPLLSLSLPLYPAGSKQMPLPPPYEPGFCSRFLPVDSEFFFALVTILLALKGVQAPGSVMHLVLKE